jgi:hypothetical protein
VDREYRDIQDAEDAVKEKANKRIMVILAREFPDLFVRKYI